jgi:hypothetical protein
MMRFFKERGALRLELPSISHYLSARLVKFGQFCRFVPLYTTKIISTHCEISSQNKHELAMLS